MNVKSFTNSVVSLAVMTLFGCGGSGGGSTTPAPPPPAGSVTISGVAAKGPINGADVTVFALNTDGTFDRSINLGTVKTSTDGTGKYSILLSSAPAGAVVVEVVGGSYTDEASGTPNIKLSAPIHAVVSAVVNGDTIALTPFTEMAYQKAAGTGTINSVIKLTKANIDDANGSIQKTFGIDNIIKTLPFDPTNAAAANAANTTPGQKKYSAALGAFSQMTVTSAGPPPTGTTLSALALGAATDKLLTDLGSQVFASGGIKPSSFTDYNNAAGVFIGSSKDKTGTPIFVAIKPTGGVLSLSTGPIGALTVTGAASKVINGIDMTLTLPAGVTVAVLASGSDEVAPGVLVLSSNAVSSNFVIGNYTPATSTAKATLRIVITNVPTGFGIGEFLHINFTGFPDGLDMTTSFPLTSVVNGGDPVLANTEVLTGITISPTSLTGI